MAMAAMQLLMLMLVLLFNAKVNNDASHVTGISPAVCVYKQMHQRATAGIERIARKFHHRTSTRARFFQKFYPFIHT